MFHRLSQCIIQPTCILHIYNSLGLFRIRELSEDWITLLELILRGYNW